MDTWSSLLLLTFVRVTHKLKKLQFGTRTTYWLSERESRTQGSRPRTQKNFEAKDKPSRGQEPRTQTQVFSKKKKGPQNFFYLKKKGLKKKMSSKFFSGEKGLQKFFFRQSLLEETKKKVFADFPQGFWRFPTTFQRFKNSAVLEPRIEEFLRT